MRVVNDSKLSQRGCFLIGELRTPEECSNEASLSLSPFFFFFNYFREIGAASVTHLPILYLNLQKIRVEAEINGKIFWSN